MKRIYVLVLGLLVSIACGRQPDLDGSRKQILSLHKSFIQAHLDKDAAYLAQPTAQDYLSVANGEVVPMTAAEVEARLAPYLEATEFSHYADLEDPIIGISDDGSIAWSIVQVRVAGTRGGGGDEQFSYDTRWAWLTLYRRDGDGWLRIADVSTNRPFDEVSEALGNG
jgi:hypothetical protein